jgi:hypothetical protein
MNWRAVRVKDRTTKCRRGLTQIELLLGLVITVMTVGALGAFMASTAQAWRSAEQVQNAQTLNLQVSNRIQNTVRTSKYLGYGGATADGQGLLFWRDDTNADGRMQLSEIGLLSYKASNQKLTLYTVRSTSPTAATLCSVTDIDDANDVANFKLLANLQSQELLKDVSGVTFQTRNPTDGRQRPSLKYQVRTEQNGRGYGETQTVTLRAPRAKPVMCDGVANCACYTTGCPCGTADSCACAGDVPCRTNTTAHCKATVNTAFTRTGTSTATASTTP